MGQAVKYLFATFMMLAAVNTCALAKQTDSVKIDYVIVKKSANKLYLFSKGKVVKSYHVALSKEPEGPKVKQGDKRVPEGVYTLDFKKSDSDFYKAIHVSYPSKKDRLKAKKLGVNPGGSIMIHGQRNGSGWLGWLIQRFNWTVGCIALSNGDMDEVWNLVKVGTPIRIVP